jgi:aminoglycoside/choline kinase family phosphotransferase
MSQASDANAERAGKIALSRSSRAHPSVNTMPTFDRFTVKVRLSLICRWILIHFHETKVDETLTWNNRHIVRKASPKQTAGK